jgi:hypothetical protein
MAIGGHYTPFVYLLRELLEARLNERFFARLVAAADASVFLSVDLRFGFYLL